MPTVLPNGNAPDFMQLYSTSCSSAAFCVAVGRARDALQNYFPVAETYSQGSWSVSVLPMPANASSNNYDGVLYSVSCPSDGVCAAVGGYDMFDPSTGYNYQIGLLETLSSGVWTPSEGALPSGVTSEAVNVNSVSCSDQADCTAVGEIDDPSGSAGLIYTWSAGSWSLQLAPVPSGFSNTIDLNGVACPDTGSCVVVGSYEDTNYNEYGLILTLASGIWTAIQAPMPANQGAALNAVDCPDVGSCVAGGFYSDPTNTDGSPWTEPVLLQLAADSWTAMEAPLPSDAPTNTVSDINGVYCPADGSCLATGNYFTDWPAGDESGLILTQSDGTWTAQSAPLPSPESASAMDVNANVAMAKSDSLTSDAASSSTVSLAGVGCGTDAFCAAAGTASSDGLLESTSISNIPSVTGVSPTTSPATGGTNVTVTGTNFTPASTVSFGGTPATSTTYVSANELQATAPPSSKGGEVDVTATVGGLTSRANPQDLFSYPTCDPAIFLNANRVTAQAKSPFSFTATTCSTSIPVITGAGLPPGLRLVNNKNGTATMSGTPGAKDNGTYVATITASATNQTTATQSLLITVDNTPVFESKAKDLVHTGTAFSYPVTTTLGSPVPTITTASTLPGGVTLTDNHNGTAVLAGTPDPNAGGVYPITITATNGIGAPVSQSFALLVYQAPVVTPIDNTTITSRVAMTPIPITATGYPEPKLAARGLPPGIKLTLGSITGTTSVAAGTYTLTVTASGKAGSTAQAFTLVVDS